MTVSSSIIKSSRTSHICRFPSSQTMNNVYKLDCIATCQQNTMCSAVNFLPMGTEGKGKCRLVAPSVYGNRNNVEEEEVEENENWELYVINHH